MNKASELKLRGRCHCEVAPESSIRNSYSRQNRALGRRVKCSGQSFRNIPQQEGLLGMKIRLLPHPWGVGGSLEDDGWREARG